MWCRNRNASLLYNPKALLIFRRFIEFIVFSNIWIAFLAAGLTFNTYIINQLPIRIDVCILVFLATFSIYNLQRLVKHFFKKNNYSKRHLWIYKNINILSIFVLLSSLGSVFLFFTLFSIQDFLFLLPFSLVSGLYAVSLFSNQRALRDLPFLKIFLISITWAVTTVIIPFLQTELTFSTSIIGQFIFTFLFIIAITIPFDIRDIDLDDQKTKTLPQVLGAKKAIYASYMLLVFAGLINYYTFFYPSYPIILIISLFFISLSNKKMPELYYSGILDGTMLLFPLLNFFFSIRM